LVAGQFQFLQVDELCDFRRQGVQVIVTQIELTQTGIVNKRQFL